MESKVVEFGTHHLKDLRSFLRFHKKTVPTLFFLAPSYVARFSLETVSDASISPISEVDSRGAFVLIRRNGDIFTLFNGVLKQ